MEWDVTEQLLAEESPPLDLELAQSGNRNLVIYKCYNTQMSMFKNFHYCLYCYLWSICMHTDIIFFISIYINITLSFTSFLKMHRLSTGCHPSLNMHFEVRTLFNDPISEQGNPTQGGFKTWAHWITSAQGLCR